MSRYAQLVFVSEAAAHDLDAVREMATSMLARSAAKEGAKIVGDVTLSRLDRTLSDRLFPPGEPGSIPEGFTVFRVEADASVST